MDNETRIRRANTFDTIAELYDRGRREIPDQVFVDLFSSTGISPSSASVLEVGCGTGQATLPLAHRGCRVLSLEMGANLSRLARQKLAGFPGISIINTRFEDWQPGDQNFDLVFATNAWHWLDPELRYARAAAALKPGGFLAFTKAVHIFPPDCDPFFPQFQSVYREIGASNISWPPPSPEEIGDSHDEIERSGYFDRVQVIRRIQLEEFSADEHFALMTTTSDHRLMDPEKREYLFNEMRRLIDARPGGRILKHNLMLLHIARKK